MFMTLYVSIKNLWHFGGFIQANSFSEWHISIYIVQLVHSGTASCSCSPTAGSTGTTSLFLHHFSLCNLNSLQEFAYCSHASVPDHTDKECTYKRNLVFTLCANELLLENVR